LAVGLVGIVRAYGSLTRNQSSSIDSEQMQQLAVDKYDELVATESLQTDSLSGDFSDRGIDKFLWSATVSQTGVTNLSGLTVTVTPREGPDTLKSTINGVVYQPPQTSTTGATP
jgi:hypothetical protein